MGSRFVISTAGHVDHGKSTLIERMTGIDPDRLAEEKERGLTIDLGFAWMRLPSGREAGIVDVPGHERFVHNMLAGVGSVDTTLFVVAANEGWMPQSEEHLAILDLLGARRGVVALTKTDRADAAQIERVRADVHARLAGTMLAGAEIVACSAVTGDGLGALDAAIDRMLEHAGTPADRGRPRVFVDRSFSIHGAGTVVTGTLTGGTLRTGMEVTIAPSGRVARVRGIQTHRVSLDVAHPVSRVALNLVGVAVDEIRRGDAVVIAGQWSPCAEIDVSLRAVRTLDHELASKSAFKAYIGSAEVGARVRFYGVDGVRPGERAFARVRLDEPVVAVPFDAVVLRDVARDRTVAGGPILDAHPTDLENDARARRVGELRARASSTPDRLPSLIVRERGVVPRERLGLMAGSSVEPPDAVVLPSFLLSEERFGAMVERIRDALRVFHQREPLSGGMPRDEARRGAGIDDVSLFGEIVEAVPAWIIAEGPLIRLATHTVALSAAHTASREALVEELRSAGFSPPPLAELRERYGEPLIRLLLETGLLVTVADGIVFGDEQLDEARSRIAASIADEGPLTAARIKDVLGTTRKWAIPLLEYFDAIGFTRRRGDLREIAVP